MSYWAHLIDRVPQGICVIEEHLIVLAWNRCLEDWTGITRSQIAGRSLVDFFPYLAAPRFYERLQLVFQHGCPAIFSSQLHGYFFESSDESGGIRLQKATVSALPRGDGRFDAVVVVEDVTETTHRIAAHREMRDRALAEIEERKHTEELLRASEKQLAEARDMAVANAESRLRLTAKVSHELRTPMNGVLGMLELIETEEEVTPRLNSRLSTIKSCAVSLLNVINEVLEHSKMESGQFSLHPVDFNLSELIQSVLDLLSTQVRDRNVVLSGRISTELPVHLHGDASRIRQILVNLIGNALKFTERGSVTAGAELVARESDGVRLRLYVADTGPGIPTEHLNSIFEEFTQLEGANYRPGGTGLGLPICRELAQRMGGELSVTSEVGLGTTITVEIKLPLACGQEVERASSPARPRAVRPDLRVLLAEDNLVNRKLGEALLGRLGCKVRTVTNGEEALQVLRDEAFDLVLMDIEMPIMDGVEATIALRREESRLGRSAARVAALSAHSPRHLEERLRGVQLDGYLRKPLAFDSLNDYMAQSFPA